jgi:methyl coenzyme M reductase gamma subunit
MYQLILEGEENKTIEAFKELADYLNQNVPENDKVVIDNAIFYSTIAMTRDRVKYIDQFTDEYYNALQKPLLYAQYIVMV